MDSKTANILLERVRQAQAPASVKQAGPDPVAAFADAVKEMDARRLQGDALHNVRNLGLTALGVGVGARGLVGLANLLRRSAFGPRQSPAGPALLPLPYPVEPSLAPAAMKPPPREEKEKAAFFGDLLKGNQASTLAGIPWYGPAMLASGVGGVVGGWKATDYALDRLRRRQTDQELAEARQEFHNALLSQYDRPLTAKAAPAKQAGLDAALDSLYDYAEKAAFDWRNAAGQALGGYGMYAGTSGVLAGMMVYDQLRKRSRQAVLNKALARRQRRQFMQQPTEIYAVPEPVERVPQTPFRREMQMLRPSPET